MVLQFVGAQLVQQTDAAALLVLVDDEPPAFLGDLFQGQLELCAAVAAQAVENVAGEALGMDAHQGRRRALQIAHLQHHRFFDAIVVAAFKAVDAEVAKPGWKIRFGYFVQP